MKSIKIEFSIIFGYKIYFCFNSEIKYEKVVPILSLRDINDIDKWIRTV